MWATTETTNNITKITANHFAIVNETPEIIPNPNNPEMIATIKNITAQTNQFDVIFMFIFTSFILN